MDYLNIGSSPCEEDCVPVGSDNYLELAREECNRYIAAIRAKLGNEPPGAKLRVKSFPHDFGTYLEVVCYFTDEESENYAYLCESHGPVTWQDTEPYQHQNS